MDSRKTDLRFFYTLKIQPTPTNRKDSHNMWKTLDEKTLKSKKVVELREIEKTVAKTITISLFIAGTRSRAATMNRGYLTKAGNLATTANPVKAAITTNCGYHVKTVTTTNHVKAVKVTNRGNPVKAANLVKAAKVATTVSK